MRFQRTLDISTQILGPAIIVLDVIKNKSYQVPTYPFTSPGSVVADVD